MASAVTARNSNPASAAPAPALTTKKFPKVAGTTAALPASAVCFSMSELGAGLHELDNKCCSARIDAYHLLQSASSYRPPWSWVLEDAGQPDRDIGSRRPTR